MRLVKKLLCAIFGACELDYNNSSEPMVHRYRLIEDRTDLLNEWKPRDLLDLR